MLNNKKNKLNKSYYNTTISKVHLLQILSFPLSSLFKEKLKYFSNDINGII